MVCVPSFLVCLLLTAVAAVTADSEAETALELAEAEPLVDAARALLRSRELLERHRPPFVLFHPLTHRFRRFDNDWAAATFEEDMPRLRKRNNAEVVNHILKNFGTLDRLGDVGK